MCVRWSQIHLSEDESDHLWGLESSLSSLVASCFPFHCIIPSSLHQYMNIKTAVTSIWRSVTSQTHLCLFPFFSFPSPMWAHCGVMPSGCVSIRNFTIRFMPIPIIDASQALKASPEKTEDALLKVCQELSMVLQASSCLVIVLNDFNSVTYVQQL